MPKNAATNFLGHEGQIFSNITALSASKLYVSDHWMVLHKF
jgi:hypothetical protein